MSEGEGPQKPSSIKAKRLIAIMLGPLAMLLLLMFPAPQNLTPEAWKLVGLAVWMMI